MPHLSRTVVYPAEECCIHNYRDAGNLNLKRFGVLSPADLRNEGYLMTFLPPLILAVAIYRYIQIVNLYL